MHTPFEKRHIDDISGMHPAGTHSWELLAHLCTPDAQTDEARLHLKGEAGSPRKRVRTTYAGRNATLAHAALQRGSCADKKDRPQLLACVLCAHHYSCNAACFPRVMLGRATFLDGVHVGRIGTNADVKKPPPCPSLVLAE